MQRIVSLAPSITETLFAVGAGRNLVGITTCCDYPKQALKINRIGGFSTPDARKIKSLCPDLVLAADFHLHSGIVGRLEREGIKVTVVKAGTVLDIPDAVKFVGRLTGCTRKAEKLAVNLKRRLKAAQIPTEKRGGDRQKVCYLCSRNPLRIARTGCCADAFISLAGGINVGRKFSGRKRISLRDVVELNPDMIVVGSGHGRVDDLQSYIRHSRTLRNTRAVCDGKIFRIPDDILSRPGPRAVKGLERFVQLLKPGRTK
ncbi:MAG: hypothetical protein A2283_18480 [Lentisphaerae bacterium RIFOXYA12_FULL_48_11]|nr:MAG: hypothetical protein A2283_18480 [Lentisphaerae bacterium RIFOXYA12_FULL_48_11]